jgi:type IV pilus assembly protein PilY1
MGGINLVGSNNNFSTVVRWMYDNDNNTAVANKQKVISYFIVDPSKVNTTTRGYAGAGVGVSSADPYTLSNDPDELVDTLSKPFRNILSVSTTFVAPSVAVNVYNRSQVLDDVYVAMFQADPDGFPGWAGNLKKYGLGLDASGVEELQDNHSPAQSAVAEDGRVKFEALSYWTITGDLPAAPSGISDIITGADGRIVSRGGAGSKIPGYKLNCTSGTDTSCMPGSYSPGLANPSGDATNVTTRKLFYDDPSNTSSTYTGLKAFNADVATATALNTLLGGTSTGSCNDSDTDPTSACNLIAWARGVYFTGASATDTKARTWIMNDMLHSRPLAINYGARASGYTTSNPDIRIVAGSNDGFLHMFRNTKTNQSNPKTPNDMDGVETWAFMPREVMPVVKTLKTNASSPITPPHPYSLDGAPVIYMVDVNGDGNIDPSSCDSNFTPTLCDKVYLYFGLRRGGSAYYAMDITDPDNPKLLWKILNTDSDFTQLGQSWSTPKVGMMLFDGNDTSKPVLVFGGGYSTNKDTHPGHGSHTSTAIGTDDSIGNAIFIVNAETGDLVWKAVFDSSATTPVYDSSARTYKRDDMKDSIPSDVTVVDSDGNGLIDRMYVGDTGGVLWRVDTTCKDQDGSSCSGGSWKATPILSVGRHEYGTSLADDRRFFYAPAYVQTKGSDGTAFDAILIGTGDRENPKDTAVTNWLYMYKDTATTSGAPQETTITHSQLTDVTCATSTSSTCVAVGAIGWKMKLLCPPNAPSTCGEKNLSPAVTLGSKVFFTSYIPAGVGSTGVCGLDEGSGLLYTLNLLDGAAVEDYDPTNNTSTQTLFKSDRYTPLSSKGIPSEIVSVGGGKYLRPDLKVGDAKTKPGYKTFWYDKGK